MESHNTGKIGSSDPVSSKPAPLIQSPEPLARRSGETPSDLAAALELVSRTRLTASQRQALLASLNARANTGTDASLPDALMQTRPPRTPTNDPPDDISNLVAALGILSDARLTQRERQLVASFTNLLATNPSAPPNLMRRNTISSLPPYSG
jgi:hypothetical protein